MTKLFWKLPLLVAVVALAAHAQTAGPIPAVSDQSLDWDAAFDKDMYAAVLGFAGIYVPMALSFINKAAVWLLGFVLITAAWESITRRTILNLDYIVRKFCIPYAVSLLVLMYWLTPIPGLGHSFIGIFTGLSSELAAYAHIQQMDQLNSLLHQVRDSMGTWQALESPIQIVAWLLITLLMATAQIAVFVVVSTGTVGVGIGACSGPIFVCFYMFPPLRDMWYSWVRSMIKYSMFRWFGNILIGVWTGFIVSFLTSVLHGQYDMDSLINNIGGFTVIMVAFVFGIFKIPHFVSDFTGGGAGGGHGLLGATAGFVRGMFL